MQFQNSQITLHLIEYAYLQRFLDFHYFKKEFLPYANQYLFQNEDKSDTQFGTKFDAELEF